MTTTPPAAIGGDELAKALRDAYGQGFGHGRQDHGSGETCAQYWAKRDAWIRQYMARLAPAAGADIDPLTAAAPSMLAALRAFDADLSLTWTGPGSREAELGMKPERREAWRSARAAIAKAEPR